MFNYLLILVFIPISLWAKTNYFKEKHFDKPIREYSIIITDQGYFPERIFAYKGEKVKIFVTTTSDKSQCMAIKDHKIFLGANKGEITQGEISFFTPGRFEIYCPSSQFKAYVNVLEREGLDEKVQEAKRDIATVKEVHPQYWTPRSYDD